MAEWTARLVEAAGAAGVPWALENPADRGQRGSPAWWPDKADHAPLWIQPCILRASALTAARSRTFSQCSFHASVQKYTTVMHSPLLDAQLGPLDSRQCAHMAEGVAHAHVAHGVDEGGRSRAAAAAAYPVALNEFLAEALLAGVSALEAATLAGEGGGDGGRQLASGGRVVDGPALCDQVRALCDAARLTPARFASARNLRAARPDHIREEALPIPAHSRASSSAPAGAKARRQQRWDLEHARRRAASTTGSCIAAGVEVGDRCRCGEHATEACPMALARAARVAEGPVAIHELYLEGIYEQVVQPWFALADAAARALRRGESAPHVPTRRIGQASMRPWARGVVWDCGDPHACVPVARSSRDTPFRGERQLDRAALRAAAHALAWHDTDIVTQAGEGGIEARSNCELETVLAFHHQGLMAEVDAADKVIKGDWEEEWADRPIPHLPFVPCRLLPRNVVMQERHRVLPDGVNVEVYFKPRITQDSSHGDEDSVNAGVPGEERYIALPTVQQLGRAVAICDTAGTADDGEGRVRATPYCVDAESAFRFCPMQEADLWTQCFVWWEGDGDAGVCVDRRLAFGGAYSPNRFERISTLVAAHVQAAHAEFDLQHPYPPSAQRWAAERKAAQARGELEAGEGQLNPRHLQVFIDDFTGTALDDVVTDSRGAAVVVWDAQGKPIVLDPTPTAAAGGTPAHPSSRVYAHACLTVLGLTELGLSAAPGKVLVGDPITALGLQVGCRRPRLDCPPQKRATMRADVAAQLARATGELRVDRKAAARLIGRLCNLSQIYPELKSTLHGGYALTEASWRVGGRRRWPAELRLGAGSAALEGWRELLEMGEELLGQNDGVALAPELAFPARSSPGGATVVTDASGVDGVGGYFFDASDPTTVSRVARL